MAFDDPKGKTKNLRSIKGLASFDGVVDCAVANNGLKRRGETG
jgi:hypothetical protein